MSRLADILSGMDRGRSRPRGLGGIPGLAPVSPGRRKWRFGGPLVILGAMLALAAGVYLRPHPDATPTPTVTQPEIARPTAPPSPSASGPAQPPGAAGTRARILAARAGEAAGRGAFGEAAEALKEATVLTPADAEAWNSLGVALVRLGDTAAGIGALRRALALAPTHAEAERNLGVALDRQGRSDEAAEHYRAFLRLAPAGDPARGEVRRRLGEIEGRKGDG